MSDQVLIVGALAAGFAFIWVPWLALERRRARRKHQARDDARRRPH